MSVKPDPTSSERDPEEANVEITPHALKSRITSIVKRPAFLQVRVPTWCVACGKAGALRKIHPREAHDFLHLHVPKRTTKDGPYYGACPKHEEIVREIAANYRPTPEERFILECCRRVGVDSITLLFDELRDVQGIRLTKLRKGAKEPGVRLAVILWARETYPGETWEQLAPRLGYRTAAAASKAYFRALRKQGGTKPKK